MSILTFSQAAQATNVSRSTIYRHAKEGRINVVRLPDGKRGIDVAELERVFGPLKTSDTSQDMSEKQSKTVKMQTSILQEKDIEFRKQEFRWQRQKFIILIIAASISILFLGLLFYGSLESSTYRVEREVSYILDRVRVSLSDNRARQDELAKRLAELEVRQRNLQDVTESLRATMDTMSNLIKELRAQRTSTEAVKQ